MARVRNGVGTADGTARRAAGRISRIRSKKQPMPDDLNLRLATLSALLELNEAVSEDDLKAAQDCRAVSRQTTRLPEASLRFALSSLVEQKKGRLLERRQ